MAEKHRCEVCDLRIDDGVEITARFIGTMPQTGTEVYAYRHHGLEGCIRALSSALRAIDDEGWL